MNRNEYFNFIHILRGFAAFLVLWSHLVGWWLGANNVSSNIQGLWAKLIASPFHLYHNGGHLGVLVFFLISGYIVTHVSLSENIRSFALKRIFRIFPALIVALVLTYIIANISLGSGLSLPLGTQSVEFKDYLYNLFFINFLLNTPYVNSVTWTLIIEVLFYAITALFLVKSRKDPLTSTWIFMLIVTIIILTYWIHPIFGNLAAYSSYIFFLIIGRTIYLAEKKLISISNSILLGFTALLIYICYTDMITPNVMFSDPNSPIYSYIWAIIIFFIAKNLFNKKYKITTFMGNISYSIYLIHVPVGSLVLNILHREGVPFKYSIIIAILICIIVSFIMYKLIEIPSQKLVRKILK